MLSRRSLLRSTATLGATTTAGLLLGAGGRGPSAAAAEARAAAREAGVFTFVSTPDFFNGDVADLSVLPGWDGGPNSVNASWEAAIDHCLAAVRSHAPDAVFVAGDQVEGRWNVDTDERRLFGPVSQATDDASLADCRRAISRAGGVYYDYYKGLWADRGLRVYAAVGDHELLDDRYDHDVDNRWSPTGRSQGGPHAGEPDNRWHLVPHAKDVWADHFTRTAHGAPRFRHRPVGTAAEGTAYAVDLGANLTLVTVDVFDHHAGGVRMGVHGGQLEWLRSTIRRAKRAGRVVIVQGHVPINRPYRDFASGNLYVKEGRRSGLYRALDECGADFYFCGEVHDTTVIQERAHAPIQISHGCVFQYAFNYLVGHVHPDGTVRLDYHEIPVVSATRERALWASDAGKRQRTAIRYGAPRHRGTMVVRHRRVLRRTSKLGVYHPATDTMQYAGNMPVVLY